MLNAEDASTECLLTKLDIGLNTRAFQPRIQGLIRLLRRENFFNPFAMLLQRDAVAWILFKRCRLNFSLEVVAYLLFVNLDAGTKAHLNKAQQRELPKELPLQILQGNPVLAERLLKRRFIH